MVDQPGSYKMLTLPRMHVREIGLKSRSISGTYKILAEKKAKDGLIYAERKSHARSFIKSHRTFIVHEFWSLPKTFKLKMEEFYP